MTTVNSMRQVRSSSRRAIVAEALAAARARRESPHARAQSPNSARGAAAGGARPRCANAAGVATRPRGVRSSRPCLSRNGSYTSSTVSGSSPTATASVPSPTGWPANVSHSACEDRPVDLVEAELVDLEQRERVARGRRRRPGRRRAPRRSRAPASAAGSRSAACRAPGARSRPRRRRRAGRRGSRAARSRIATRSSAS